MLSRRLLKLILAASLAPAMAPAMDVAAPEPSFARVFDMPVVEALTFNTDTDEFFAVADGAIWRWSLDPLDLMQRHEVDGLISDLAFSPSDLLLAVGQRWSPETKRLLGAYAVGYEVSPNPGEWLGYEFYAVRDTALKTRALSVTGIAQFSSAGFDGRRILIVSPTDVAMTIVDDGPIDVTSPQVRPNVKLACGPSVQFSVAQLDGQARYFSSTSEPGMLEIGLVRRDTNEKRITECINITRLNGATAQKAITRYPIAHALLTLPGIEDTGGPNAVLVLEPNAGRLYLFAIESFGGEVFLTQIRSAETALTGDGGVEGAYTLLTASPDGTEILVSGQSQKQVLRFEVTEELRLRTRGRYVFEKPVRRLEISDDGEHVAIVTGEAFGGGDQDITLIRHPDDVADNTPIPDSFDGVRVLQTALNEAGFAAGKADGEVGPNTRSAIAAYIEKGAWDEGAMAEISPIIEAVFPTEFEER